MPWPAAHLARPYLVKLYAISDLHVGHPDNRGVLERTPAYPDDWLILGGDIGETARHLAYTLNILRERFARILWVPGNHELWTIPGRETLRGRAKYEALVEICRHFDVITPEDPYVVWPGEGGPHLLCPLFLLYDYTFGPDGVAPEQAVDWARETGIECADEVVLHPDPYESRAAWCAARCDETERRLERAVAEHDCPLVLINHFPLRRELAVLPRIPRFSVWCGTRRSEDWHTRFRADIVLYGHLHIRRTQHIDGVRFQEVSMGYPRQWQHRIADEGAHLGAFLCPILP